MKGCLYMTMTYEEVLEKIKSSGKVTITETKAAQNAKSNQTKQWWNN